MPVVDHGKRDLVAPRAAVRGQLDLRAPAVAERVDDQVHDHTLEKRAVADRGGQVAVHADDEASPALLGDGGVLLDRFVHHRGEDDGFPRHGHLAFLDLAHCQEVQYEAHHLAARAVDSSAASPAARPRPSGAPAGPSSPRR